MYMYSWVINSLCADIEINTQHVFTHQSKSTSETFSSPVASVTRFITQFELLCSTY